MSYLKICYELLHETEYLSNAKVCIRLTLYLLACKNYSTDPLFTEVKTYLYWIEKAASPW